MKASFALSLLAALSVLTACGKPFEVKTGADFAELPGQSGAGFDYRATTPEGVAVSVTSMEDREKADLSFWTKAITLKLHDQDGYALLGEEAVKDKNGTPGRRLRFAREEDKKKFDYRVTIYRAQGRIFLVESGGPHEAFSKAESAVVAMESSVAVRCPSAVAPVLASRTCNRW